MSSEAFDIFISYCRRDRAVVDKIWGHVTGQHWRTWRDDFLPSNSDFEDEILARLRVARCAIVVWSREAVQSAWVRREAMLALEQGSLFQVQLDDCPLPEPFDRRQAAQLQTWDGEIAHAAFAKLLVDLARHIGPKKPVGTFPVREAYEPVSDKHIALVHNSFRRADRDAEFPGETMYQIHVLLVGRSEVLDQVESVIYHLDPTYPKYTYLRTAEDRRTNFGLKELANGFSVLRATVKVKGQNELVELSRFVNLYETETRLDEQFIGKKLWYEELP